MSDNADGGSSPALVLEDFLSVGSRRGEALSKRIAVMRHSFRDDRTKLADKGIDVERDPLPDDLRSAEEKLVALRLNDGLPETFTAEQSRDKLAVGGERAEMVLTFAKSGARNAEFLGAYEVGSELISYEEWKGRYREFIREVPEPLDELFDSEQGRLIEGLGVSATPRPKFNFYDLERADDVLDGLEGRLVIRWPEPFVNWVRRKGGWPDGTDTEFEVVEIRAPGFVKPFPGYREVDVSWRELSSIYENADGNRRWREKLSSVSGVYLITDAGSDEGHLYVGAASGEDGVWGRWSDYVAHPYHGGNEGLARRLENESTNHHNWRFSLLEVMSTTTRSKEVLAAESRWKRRLGSRTYGLNQN